MGSRRSHHSNRSVPVRKITVKALKISVKHDISLDAHLRCDPEALVVHGKGDCGATNQCRATAIPASLGSDVCVVVVVTAGIVVASCYLLERNMSSILQCFRRG
jgi:hypothetical protein